MPVNRIRCLTISLLLSGLFVLLLFFPVHADKIGSGENHALIIGISAYDEWPSLKSPSKDARKIAGILTRKYDFKKENVVLLTDGAGEKPTLVSILGFLDSFFTELTEKNNLLVFFSGHGTEDERGETYWIPRDGKKTTKMTWLKHAIICKEFFASPNFKVKNLLIITDTPFYPHLPQRHENLLSPYDLRYPEKLKKSWGLRSREIIAFGDRHWPGTSQTNGMGLFAYYIHKALEENSLELIDFENLIFDENIVFPIVKISGTRLIRGRLKTPMEQRGRFTIKKDL